MKTASARRYTVQSRCDSEAGRINYMLQNMQFNKSYVYASQRANGDPERNVLHAFQERFRQYRNSWRNNPKYAIDRSLHYDSFQQSGLLPLCVDIETAAICDLYSLPIFLSPIYCNTRQFDERKLYYRIIEQCAELGSPSVKLNRREGLNHVSEAAKAIGLYQAHIKRKV